MSKAIVGWSAGTDPRTPEERAALRREGKLKADKLRAEAQRANKTAKRERKVQKLNDMGPDGNREKKRMRDVHYGGQKPSPGTAWQENGPRKLARGKQSMRKSAPK